MNSDLFSSSVLGSEITVCLAAKELGYTEENQVLKVSLSGMAFSYAL